MLCCALNGIFILINGLINWHKSENLFSHSFGSNIFVTAKLHAGSLILMALYLEKNLVLEITKKFKKLGKGKASNSLDQNPRFRLIFLKF